MLFVYFLLDYYLLLMMSLSKFHSVNTRFKTLERVSFFLRNFGIK